MLENVAPWHLPGALVLAAGSGIAGLISRRGNKARKLLVEALKAERDQARELHCAEGAAWDKERRDLLDKVGRAEGALAGARERAEVLAGRVDGLNQRLEALTQYDGKRLRHKGRRNQKVVLARVLTSLVDGERTLLIVESEPMHRRPSVTYRLPLEQVTEWLP